MANQDILLRPGLVYKATNLINGKFYIGVTSKTLKERRRAHYTKAFSKAKNFGKFHRAIKKHGKQNFSWEVLCEFSSFKEALIEEGNLIAKLKPQYNITSGGEYPINPVLPLNSVKVLCLEDGIVFDSIRLTAKHYNVTASCIDDAIHGRCNTSAGKHFIRFERDLTDKERAELIVENTAKAIEDRKWKNRDAEWCELQRAAIVERGKKRKSCKPRIIKSKSAQQQAINNKEIWASKYAHLGPKSSSKKVICLDDNLIHESASAAGRYYNIIKSSIIELCLGKNFRRTAGGLKFKYLE